MTLPDPPSPQPSSPVSQPPSRPGRRSALLGYVIALLIMAAVGWLAWYLTHRPPATAAPGAGPTATRGAAGAPAGPGGGAPGAGRGGPPTTVGLAVAEKADIPVTVDALGTVVPVATARVRPQVSGVLQQVLYREGQMVQKGELLALIDPRSFEMALQQAAGQRMRDEAQLEAARVTLQRFRTLLEQDSIARQEVDTQAALVRQLEAAVVIDKANEGTARLNLSYARIVAPISGRVGLRTVDVGNVVSTSDANGVAVITQMSPIDVQFAVPQDLVGSLHQPGGGAMPVKAMDRTRAQVLDTGSFLSFDNLIDTQTGTVKAKARFANAQGVLFPNQFVNVQVQLRTIEGATMVPVAAVRKGPSGDQVFVLNPDRTVSLREVQRGQTTGDKVQIVRGVTPGEKVVTEGADRLRDGARVVLPGQGATGPGQGAAGQGRQRAGGQGRSGQEGGSRAQQRGQGAGAPAP